MGQASRLRKYPGAVINKVEGGFAGFLCKDHPHSKILTVADTGRRGQTYICLPDGKPDSSSHILAISTVEGPVTDGDYDAAINYLKHLREVEKTNETLERKAAKVRKELGW